MRMFIDLVEARFKVACQGTHIHSHKGEPGNELVDALANSAAKGIATHDLDPFFSMFFASRSLKQENGCGFSLMQNMRTCGTTPRFRFHQAQRLNQQQKSYRGFQVLKTNQ